MADEATVRRHVAEGASVCPFCRSSDHAVYFDLEPDEEGEVTQIGSCTQCKKSWQDIFTLTDMKELAYVRPQGA